MNVKVKERNYKTILTYGNDYFIIKGINCEVMKKIRESIKTVGICMVACALVAQCNVTKVFADDFEISKMADEETVVGSSNVVERKTEDSKEVNGDDSIKMAKATKVGKVVNKVTDIKKVKKVIRVNQKINLNSVKCLKSKKMKNLKFNFKKNGLISVSKNGVVKANKVGVAIINVKEDGAVIAKVNIEVKESYKEEQLRLLSSIIFCEANTESYAGKKAVGIVVMNRMASSAYPSSMKAVVYQRGQFVPAHTGFLDRAYKMYDNGSIPKDCVKAAKDVLSGSRSVIIKGKEKSMKGYLFFSRYVPNKKLQIGAHQFK
ncbi:Cell Wall Hydrolase [Eubacterium uniforme]|uniref:Cell Wall Hydrolase n=1 Tax=Eubacterium uniforme TaxID=39495 RepID=A0A1T4V9P3_9FIRM|nr:cell wall hydrolase [Eubacterium uniforme]SKA61653.1 Cell Wall Hydrolase [Eubacterium uniforme]